MARPASGRRRARSAAPAGPRPSAPAVLALAVAVLASAAGCGRERPSAPVTVTDSAGARVVISRRPAWPDGRGWTVESRPAATLGGGPGDLDFRVDDALRLPDGRLAALDGRGRRLAVGTGEDEPTVVELPAPEGAVDGPLGLAGLLPGDTLALREEHTDAVRLVGPDGRPGRRYSLEGPGGFAPRVRGVFGDGTLVATPRFDRVVLPGGEILRDTLPLLTFGPEGARRDTLGSVAGAERYFARVESGAGEVVGRVRRPYAREELAAVGDSVLVTASSHALAWAARGRDGRLRVRASAPFRARPVEAGDIRSYREGALRRAPEGYRELRRKLLREVPFPGRKPILSDLRVDPEGHVWVGLAGEPWTPPTRWRVFAPDGRWLGTVSTPPGLEVRQVGSDFVAGVLRGGDGEPVAAFHRLRRKVGPDRDVGTDREDGTDRNDESRLDGGAGGSAAARSAEASTGIGAPESGTGP